MTTTKAMPTVEELREQIAEHEKKLREAEQELGRLTLDGGDTRAATKRANESRQAISRLTTALEELERRESTAERERQLAEASARRLGEYRWAAAFMERAEAVFAAQEAARAAEDALLELGNSPDGRRIGQAKLGHRYVSAESVDLLTDLVAGLPPFPRRGRGEEPLRIGGERFTADAARELRQLAERLAAEEEAGEGVDHSGTPSTATLRHRERRAQLKAAREEEKRRRQEQALEDTRRRAEAQAAAGERA